MTDKRGVSRRDFIKGAAAGVAVGALTQGAPGYAAAPARAAAADQTWDKEAEVVVVGSGFAGLFAAIAAYDAGAKPLVIEKMPHVGGISLFSGGGVMCTNNVDSAVKYLTVTNDGNTDPEVIRAQADGMFWAYDWLVELAKTDGAVVSAPNFGAAERGYAFPGQQNMNSASVSNVPGFTGWPFAPGSFGGGARLIKLAYDNIEKRGVEVMLEAPFKDLIRDTSGAVIGVLAEREGSEIRIKASRAVVMACGGFENNPAMFRQYMEMGGYYYNIGSTANTGDGMRAVQKAGADLWHMWHTHNAMGFRYVDENGAVHGFRLAGGGPRENNKFPYITVDKYGRRYTTDMHVSPADTRARPSIYLEPDELVINAVNGVVSGYPRLPSYLIFDEEGRKVQAVCNPTGYPDQWNVYNWSRDNSVEVEKGWIAVADTIEGLADEVKRRFADNEWKMDPGILRAQIDRWNGYVAAGKDGEFFMPPKMMTAIKTPPFYAMELWPIVTNTQGGPRHNAKQQIVDPDGKPIPRLYAAGEFGSMYGSVYLLAGNISECVVSGRISGQNAAAEAVWG